MAEDVGFEGGVHGYDSESADHFGAVGNFCGTEHELIAEEVEIGEHFCFFGVGEGEGACASEFASSHLHEVDNGVLNHFGVHFEGGKLFCVAEAEEHGVGHIAHTRLDGEEALGDASGADFADEEVADVGSDLEGGVVECCESFDAVVGVAMHDARDFGGVELHGRVADSVARFVDGYLATVGRVEGEIDVVESIEAFGELVVELKEDFFCMDGIGGHIAYACAEDNFAVVEHFCHFDDGHVEVAICAVAELLCELREVEVEVVAVVGVDACAQVWCVLVG